MNAHSNSPSLPNYSLGVTLIYALTRKAPEELASDGLQLVFRPWVTLPEAFADVLEKMIAPDWQSRYADALALQADLLALKAGKPTSLQVKKNVWTEPLPAKYRTYLLLGGGCFRRSVKKIGKRSAKKLSVLTKSSTGKDMGRCRRSRLDSLRANNQPDRIRKEIADTVSYLLGL